MSILEKAIKEANKKECKKNNHEWDFEVHTTNSTVYECKHCSSILIEPNDCEIGA